MNDHVADAYIFSVTEVDGLFLNDSRYYICIAQYKHVKFTGIFKTW